MQDQQQQTKRSGSQPFSWLPAPADGNRFLATPGCTATAHISSPHSSGHKVQVAHLHILEVEGSNALCEILSVPFHPASSLTRSLNASIASSVASGTIYECTSHAHVPLSSLQRVCRPDPRNNLAGALRYLTAATGALSERQIVLLALTANALTAAGVGYDYEDATDQQGAVVDGLDLIGCLAAFRELPTFFVENVDRDFYAASTVINALSSLSPRHVFTYVNSGCDDGASESTHLIEVEDVAVSLIVSMGPYSDDGTDATCLATVCLGDSTERAAFFHSQINQQMNDLGDMFAQAACQLEPEHIRESIARLSAHPTLAHAFIAQ